MLGSVTFVDDIPAGTKLYAATWLNTNEQGSYLSLRLTWPMERADNGGRDDRLPARAPQRPASRMLDDEIPF